MMGTKGAGSGMMESGMRVDAWTAVHETHREGTRYVFCSLRCRERFEAAPSEYLAKGPPDARS